MKEEDKLNETMMNQMFGNRRKMAFWSLYTIIFMALLVTGKLVYVPAADVPNYANILTWIGSILGGIVLGYFGTVSFEQDRNSKINPAAEKKEPAVAVQVNPSVTKVQPAPQKTDNVSVSVSVDNKDKPSEKKS